MSKKPFGGSTLFVVFGLLFIALIGLRTISTPEIWTHLAQGQSSEPVTSLAANSGVNTTWLYDKLVNIVWNIGGPSLLIILNVIGLLSTFFLLSRISERWGGPLSQGFAILFSGHLIFQSVDVGPEVVMMLSIAATLYVLSTAKSQAMLFGALIPIQLLWTNMHGSFLFGPILVGLTALQASQQTKGATRKKKQGIPAATLGIVALVLLVVTLVNPSFIKLHSQALAGISSPEPIYWSSLFIEYFKIPALKPLVTLLLVVGAGGLITLKKKLPIMLTTIAIFGAFLAVTSPQKHAVLFVVLTFPFIVLSLTAIAEHIQGSLNGILGKGAKLLPGITGGIFVLLMIVSLIPVVTNRKYVKTGSASTFGLGVEEKLYPADCEAIFNHPSFPKNSIINTEADGGYLAYKYGLTGFVDYRSGRYSDELLKNLKNMLHGSSKAYDTLYEEYRPEALIINTFSLPEARPLEPHTIYKLLTRTAPETGVRIWKLAYFDGTTLILLRNKDEYRSIFENTEIQKAGLAKLEAARVMYSESAGTCKAGNPAELIGAAKVYLALNRPVEAKAIFSLILQGKGEIPAAWIGLGNSQLLLMEFDESVKSLKTATKQVPNSMFAWLCYAEACKLAGHEEEHLAAVEQVKKLAERNKSEEVDETDLEPAETKVEKSLQDITIPEN